MEITKPTDQQAFDAEFASMFGVDAAVLLQTPEDHLHAQAVSAEVGHTALTSYAETRDIVDQIPSMTSDQLEDYYAHVDNYLNPRLEARGFSLIDADIAERARNIVLAQQQYAEMQRITTEAGPGTEEEEEEDDDDTSPPATVTTLPTRTSRKPNIIVDHGQKKAA